jgi:hypothetical protein
MSKRQQDTAIAEQPKEQQKGINNADANLDGCVTEMRKLHLIQSGGLFISNAQLNPCSFDEENIP